MEIFDYDNVLLLPRKCRVESRSQCDPSVEFGGRTFPEIGIPEGYHGLTHHDYDQVKIAKVIQIQTYHARHFAYYLDKLRATPDGAISLPAPGLAPARHTGRPACR